MGGWLDGSSATQRDLSTDVATMAFDSVLGRANDDSDGQASRRPRTRTVRGCRGDARGWDQGRCEDRE